MPPAPASGSIGFIPLLVGILIAGIALLDPREDAFPSGRAPAFAAGLAFFFAGTAVLINGWKTPYRNLLLQLNTMLLLGSFALVPLGIAWSAGAHVPLVVGGLACAGLAMVAIHSAFQEWRRLSREGRPPSGS